MQGGLPRIGQNRGQRSRTVALTIPCPESEVLRSAADEIKASTSMIYLDEYDVYAHHIRLGRQRGLKL